MYNGLDDIDRTQRELQEVYEGTICNQCDRQRNQKKVSITFTQAEIKKVCDFFDTFAYS